MNAAFARSAALLGEAQWKRLAAARVAVVGVGGVGSWCAEALARTGVGRLVLIDDDTIAESNLNRQCPALATTVGRSKVEVMRERLLAITPHCEVVASAKRFVSWPSCAMLSGVDFIVDAIDSVDCKAELILGATENQVPIVSSMGAALRIDPTQVVVKRFDKVEGDGLARALRQRFKRLNRFPAAKFDCVCSLESPRSVIDADSAARPSYMPVTCAFGMALAATVVRSFEQGCA